MAACGCGDSCNCKAAAFSGTLLGEELEGLEAQGFIQYDSGRATSAGAHYSLHNAVQEFLGTLAAVQAHGVAWRERAQVFFVWELRECNALYLTQGGGAARAMVQLARAQRGVQLAFESEDVTLQTALLTAVDRAYANATPYQQRLAQLVMSRQALERGRHDLLHGRLAKALLRAEGDALVDAGRYSEAEEKMRLALAASRAGSGEEDVRGLNGWGTISHLPLLCLQEWSFCRDPV